MTSRRSITSPLLEKMDSKDIVSQAFLVLYTWTLILIYLKDSLSSSTNQERSTMLKSVLNTFTAFTKQNPSDNILHLLTILSSSIGGMNFSLNIPFTDSSLLIDQEETNCMPLEKSIDRYRFHLFILFLAMNQLENHCLAHLAIEEESILSFYDLNMDYGDEGITSCFLFANLMAGAFVLIRNATKKTMWNAELFYKLGYTNKNSENVNTLSVEKELCIDEDDPETKTSQSSLVGESLDVLNVGKEKTSEVGKNFQELLEDQFQMEEEYDQKPLDYWRFRDEKKYLSSREIKDDNQVKADGFDVKIMNKIKGLKLLLLNTGVLSVANLDKVY